MNIPLYHQSCCFNVPILVDHHSPLPQPCAEPAEPAEPGTAGIEGLVEAESESKDGGRRGPRDLKGTSPMEPQQNFQKA